MNADKFLASLRPYLARGPRGRQMAIEEIDGALASLRETPNPEIGPEDIERIRQAKVRIQAGRMPT